LHIGHNAWVGSSFSEGRELGGELRDERGESSPSRSIDSGSWKDEAARVEFEMELTGLVGVILDPGDDSDILGQEV
jgi:hypothetical protein